MEDDGLLKTKKKNALTDEKRAQVATRMRELNDKRILDAATKIMNTLKPAESPAPVIETVALQAPVTETPKPEPTPTLEKPKKKRIIQIVQLESDDDEDEPMELVMPKSKSKKEGVRGNVVPLPEPEPEPKAKPKAKPKPKPVEPPKQPPPTMVRCRFL
jgi:protein TonB